MDRSNRTHQDDKDSRHSSSKSESSCSSKKRIDRSYEINKGKTTLIIKQGDITRTKVDAIVNAANEHMTGGAGVDGMIHRAAGSKLYDECVQHRQVMSGVRLPTGRSRILLSYDLSQFTSYIINTAGPVYNRRAAKECEEQLRSCYKTAIELANLYDLESIAFPAISCGIFGYPADDGARTALETADKEAGNLKEVMFVLWDDHIYDAWMKQAEKIGFNPRDNASTKTKLPSPNKSIVTGSQGKTTNPPKPKTTDNVLPPDNTYSPLNVIDATTTTPEKETASPVEEPMHTPPTTPPEISDSQKTVEMDDVDDETIKKTPLIEQQTVEMTSMSESKPSDPKTSDERDKLSVEEQQGSTPADETSQS